MSTYYYLVCDTHREYTCAASRTAGGYCPLGDSDKTLRPFVIAHAGCAVRILSEHSPEAEDGFEGFREWEAEKVDAEIEAAHAAGRWK